MDIGCLVIGTKILDHPVRMEDITANLRSPFDFLFLSFKFGLLFLTFLEFQVVEMGFEDTQSVLTVVNLERVSVFSTTMPVGICFTRLRLNFVDILPTCS